MDDVVDADAPESAIPSETSLIQQERAARRKRLAVGLGLVVVLVGGAVGGLTYQGVLAKRDVDDALGALDRCLLGEPLLDGETPSLRFRRTQLTAMGVPVNERAQIGELAWPQTCATFAHKLKETADAAGIGDDSSGLRASAAKLAAKLKEKTSITENLTSEIDRVYADAKSAEVNATTATTGDLPPPASEVFSAESLKPLPALSKQSFDLKNIHVPYFPTEMLRFLVDDKELAQGPAVCELDPNATEVHCRPVPKEAASLSPGLRLWGTQASDTPPYIFAGDRGSAGIFSSDGTKITAPSTAAYGAYAKSPTELHFLHWDEGDPDNEESGGVVQVRTGQKPQLILPRTEIGNPYYTSGVLWDQVVYRHWTDKHGMALFARDITDIDGEFKPVGELAERGRVAGNDDPPHIAGCRTEKAIIARVRGSSGDQLAFRVGNAWQPPLITNGVPAHAPMTCRGAEATFTWGDNVGVAQHKCSAAACSDRFVSLDKVLHDDRELEPQQGPWIAGAEVSGKALLIWSPGGSYGLRLKLGPVDQLPAASNVAIYDDFEQEQTVKTLTTLFGFRLISRGDVALLVLSTVAGVHTLVIDESGKVTPIPVVWEG